MLAELGLILLYALVAGFGFIWLLGGLLFADDKGASAREVLVRIVCLLVWIGATLVVGLRLAQVIS